MLKDTIKLNSSNGDVLLVEEHDVVVHWASAESMQIHCACT